MQGVSSGGIDKMVNKARANIVPGGNGHKGDAGGQATRRENADDPDDNLDATQDRGQIMDMQPGDYLIHIHI